MKDIIDYDKIYHSKYDGDFKILQEIEHNKFGHRQVLIEWINTKNKQIIELQLAKKGIARDKEKRAINYNKIYYSNNFGPFKMLRKLDHKNNKGNHILIEIEFIETGTIKEVRLADALCGNIRDEYRPTIHNVACIGKASSYNPAYNIWESMINRCYNKNNTNYDRYGGRGVTVCNRWLCFEYFLEDLPLIDGYNNYISNPGLYSLDKDYKQMYSSKKRKIYSLETCCFIPNSENSRIARFEQYNKYIGVSQEKSGFKSSIFIGSHRINLGIYNSEDLAAAAYNNALNYYYKNSFIKNNVPNINPNELINLNMIKKEMCKIIS